MIGFFKLFSNRILFYPKLLLSPDASGTNGIHAFGIHSEMQHTQTIWGTIKVGSKSDLVILNANPLDSIENSKEISGIVFHGKYYSQKKLIEQLK